MARKAKHPYLATFNPYGFNWSLSFTREQFALVYSGNADEWITDTACGIVHGNDAVGVASVVIALDRIADEHALHGVIAHEAHHLISAMWRWLGEKAPGEEVHAYMLQWAVEQMSAWVADYRVKQISTATQPGVAHEVS
jgi:hypothetical protein